MRRFATTSPRLFLLTCAFTGLVAATSPAADPSAKAIAAAEAAEEQTDLDDGGDDVADATTAPADALDVEAEEARTASDGEDAEIGDAADAAALGPVTYTWNESANRTYYDSVIHLKWRNELGDWHPTPIGSALVTDTNEEKKIRIPVTGNDFLLRTSGVGSSYYYTRQSKYASRRPYLRVNGSKTYYSTRDTFIEGGFSTPQGGSYSMRDTETMLIAFDGYQPRVGDRAELVLTTYKQYTTHTLYAYRPDVRPEYPDIPHTVDGTVVRNVDGSDFAKINGRMINNDIVTGYWEGTGLTAFAPIFKLPPADEYYMTVVIKLHGDYPNKGGKLPGLANTGQAINTGGRPISIDGVNCSNAGWGGRSANGCRWSARTGWWGRSGDKIGVGGYFYALSPSNDNGSIRYLREPVTAGKWFAYVQRVKLNTVGEGDGMLSYWLCVDGACKPSMHAENITWRNNDLPESQISEMWGNVFCGGSNCGVAPWPRSTTSIRRMTTTVGLPDLDALQAEVAALNGD